MSINYNETLSTLFSKQVRDLIQTPQSPELHTVRDIFPNLKIKEGSAAAGLWALENKYMSYLGGSPTSTLTGIGASISIIDDLVKNAYEALNDVILEGHYNFYNNTLKQRIEEGGKEIICFTRWATKDLIGCVLANEPDKWDVIEFKAIKDNGEYLCPELLSAESLADKRQNMMPEIFEANYFQKPMDIQGLMYGQFKTYTDIPETFESIECYIDTADEGDDFLCGIIYGKLQGLAYVLDVVYCKDAQILIRNNVKIAHVESNNGGRGFARAVENITRSQGKSITYLWFHQSENKNARIFNNSNQVTQKVIMPAGWQQQFYDFAAAIRTYKKEGKNKHDDAADAITGVVEKMFTRNFYAGVAK